MTTAAIVAFLTNYWPVLAPVLYELLARVLPTNKDITITNAVKTFLDEFIPNFIKSNGKINTADLINEAAPVIEQLAPQDAALVKAAVATEGFWQKIADTLKTATTDVKKAVNTF